MNKFLVFCAIFCMLFVGCESNSPDINKILVAKDRVKSIVNYPDTLSFHEFDTKVNGNVVTLKFTCENAFGVPDTRTMSFNIE
jgi:hypothetical protein